MSVLIDLDGDPSFDLEIQGQSNLHGRIEWRPLTGTYRVVKADGSTQVISATQTRPQNRSLSNIGLNDPESPSFGQPQCLWDNAAWEPAISRTAPASFTGNAVASWRLFDDSDRCWWIVVEAVSDQLVVWLHRPATIFLQAMQSFPAEDRELNRFYLPSHLVGEQVQVAFNPRGNKAILQVISDRAPLPLDSAEGAAPERYTLPWAQYVRVLDFTGTGSWPEQPSEPAWGVGIESVASLYVSPYSAGTGTLVTSRNVRQFGAEITSKSLDDSGHYNGGTPEESYSYWSYDATWSPAAVETALSNPTVVLLNLSLTESISAPIVIFIDDSGQVSEVTAHLTASDQSTPSSDGAMNGWIYEEQSDLGGPILTDKFDAGSGGYRTNRMQRDASYQLLIKVNGQTAMDCQYSITGQVYQAATADGSRWTYGPLTAVGAQVDWRVNDRIYRDTAGATNWVWGGIAPFFDVRWDAGALTVLHGEGGVTDDTRAVTTLLCVRASGQVAAMRYWGESGSPNASLYVAHDGAGRRTYQPYPARSSSWDAGDGTDRRDVNQYIAHSLDGRESASYIQLGFVEQWKNNGLWIVLGYC